MTAGDVNTRYPIPPTSTTTESAATAPTTPSTEAIIGRYAGSSFRGRHPATRSAGRASGAGFAARRGLAVRGGFAVRPSLPGERLADGALVRRLAAGDRCDRRAIHDRGPCRTPRGGRPPLERPLAVRDADPDRERVRGVVRVRDVGELQDDGHHPAHLLLVGGPVPGDRDLDLVGGRLADRDVGLGRSQEDDASRLAHGEGRL